MKMTEEVVNALQNRNESKLYHAMYDIYEKDSVEAAKAFNQWKLEVKVCDTALIARAAQRIYDNEKAVNSMF